MITLRQALLIFAVLVATPCLAFAQGASAALYGRVAGPLAPPLSADGAPLTLRRGLDYRIVAACGAGCERLRLRLVDPNGAAVSGVQAARSAVMLRPAQTGVHRVRVEAVPAGAPFTFSVYAR